MTDVFMFQQALFGYRDGHTMLSCSVSLSSRARQLLTSITDSSGPGSEEMCRGAYTGVQIEDTDYYALICTWPALEMPRPGCVWSHVILINLVDLPRLYDLSELRPLFKRPRLTLIDTDYRAPITKQFDRDLSPDVTVNPGRLAILLRALYKYPDSGIVISDLSPSEWELCVFIAWNQQWPKLRRQFSFSTISLGDRRLGGIPFDLQVACVNSERMFDKSESKTLFVKCGPSERTFENEPILQWLELLAQDCLGKAPPDFHQFLFDYGSDVERPREACWKLASIYLMLHGDNNASLSQLLSSVSVFFPSPNDAARLKKALLQLSLVSRSADKYDELWAKISFLTSPEARATFPTIDFDFRSATSELWNEKRDHVVELFSRLLRDPETPAAVGLAEGVANSIDAPTFRLILENHAELAFPIIRYNPSLAFDSKIWMSTGDVQSHVYDALKAASLTQGEWGKIVGAMFIAATYVSVREAVERAGPFAMIGAFAWLESKVSHEVLPSRGWRDALQTSAKALLISHSDLTSAQLALSAWCLSNDDVRLLITIDRTDVRRMSDDSLESIPAPLRVYAAFVLMSIGLRGDGDCALKLVERNFFTVHDALATGTQASDSWWLIEPELPPLGSWRDWDRCERLRRAASTFLDRYDDRATLARLAKTPAQRATAREVEGAEPVKRSKRK